MGSKHLDALDRIFGEMDDLMADHQTEVIELPSVFLPFPSAVRSRPSRLAPVRVLRWPSLPVIEVRFTMDLSDGTVGDMNRRLSGS